MPETFDLIVRGGEVVNHAGRGRADVGVRAGKIAAIGDLAQASAGEVFDARGPHRAARRDRHPGAFPRAGPGVEGRPGDRLARGGAGRRHRRVRDAQHRPDHHRPPRPWPTSWPGPRAACTATTPSTSAAPHENAGHLGELERLPGCCGVKVFMGASTGTLLVADDDGLRRRCCSHVPPRAPSTPRTSAAWPSAGRWRGTATGPATRRSATPRPRHPVHRAADAASPTRLGKRVHVLHVTTAEEIEFLGAHKDVATVRGDPAAPDPGRARGLRAAEGLGPDEPADPRRAPPRRACGAGSPMGVVDVIGSDHAPHTLRGEGAALSGLALRHAGRADAGAGDADPRGRGPADAGALRRPDQRRRRSGSSASPTRAAWRWATTPT